MTEYKGYEDFKKNATGGAQVYPKTGVAPDYINAWMVVGLIGNNRNTDLTIPIDRLPENILHYEEYMRKAPHQFTENVIADSDPAKVICLNSLADTFNAIRNKLVNEENYITIELFFKLADQLIRKTNRP